MGILDNFKVNYIQSTDCKRIGYREIGSGPGIILVHGALQSSLNFSELAKALSDSFTVYIPDRRGRGLTDSYNAIDNLDSEASDISALIHHTKAQNIFGLSSGAIIALKAALIERSLKKVVLYEPPIPVNGISLTKLDTAYDGAVNKGNFGKAFIAIVKATGDASFFNLLPSFITAPVMNKMMKEQIRNSDGNKPLLRNLVPTFHYDRIVAKESEPLVNDAKTLKASVLLLGGSKSQKYLKQALDQLQISIPKAKRIEFQGLGHLGADNSGSPQIIAHELIKFFKKQT
jgi:pimeloyl-ACP methyl ester carboxylesterase